SREIVCVGRLSSEKAPSVLVDALSLLREGGVDARLVFVGDGDMRPALERQVATLGLAGCVEVAGGATQEPVRQRIAGSPVLALPSFMEGLRVVLLEAMAMGRPVIASAVAGIPEVVRPGSNGWLVTAGRADELAAAMREAMLAPADRLTEMGRRGREVVLARH